MQKAVDYIRKLGLTAARIGVEMRLPAARCRPGAAQGLPDSEIVDASSCSNACARENADELAKLRIASDGVIDSMRAVIAEHGPGTTKRELAEALRREETNRGLTFEYCLIAAGTSHNRAPSDQQWEKGDVMSLDSGGNYHGYIGDIAAWRCSASPMPNSVTCSPKSRRSSARRCSDQGRRHGQR